MQNNEVYRNEKRKNMLKTSIKQSVKAVVRWGYHRFRKDIISDRKYVSFGQRRKHVFFGYYDLDQFDRSENRILVHVVPKNAETITDNAEIGYYSLIDNTYHRLTETGAWCWQQGARLRWHPLCEEVIIFNDLLDGGYVTKEMSVESGQVIKCYDKAFYDISNDMRYGLSLNFSRLQRLRPGYGYSKIEDETIGQSAPDDDGIFYVDLKSGVSELLVSLRELAATVPQEHMEKESEHYVNHISISPDSDSFMFFHIWTIPTTNRWETRLCIYDIKAKSFKVAEDRYMTSHYCWKDGRTLLLTCYENRKCFYEELDIETCKTRRVHETFLCFDGHPTYLQDKLRFISDSYPNRVSEQILLCGNVSPDHNNYETLATVFHSPFMGGEKRCDLHPRVAKSNTKVCIDTTCTQGVRKCVLFEL